MNDIFGLMYPDFKFPKDKKIRLFEAFAGIGTQALALKYLNIPVEHVGISEVDSNPIKSHEALHGKIINLGGVGTFKTFPPNIDIMTWSFPCGDVSNYGKQGGMNEGTQSNYGYIFLDTIENMSYEDRPQVMIMENVKALTQTTFEKDYQEIHRRLEKMGYQSYGKVLSAVDYGVPQTRERIFVVSIKGEYNYNFPIKTPNDIRIKHLLDNDTEHVYLSDDEVERMRAWKSFQNPLDDAKTKDDKYLQTITRRGNMDSNASNILIKEYGKYRLLTPLECWRFMGIKDEDFYKVKNNGARDQELFEQAGNAIVVDVLMAIFKEMF